MSSERGFEKIEEYEKEINRIRKTLGELLDKKAAKELTAEIYEIALDIDQAIDRLLEDPRVLKKYNYDGEFFEPKDGGSSYKTYDGPHFLREAASDDNLKHFFKHESDKDRAIGETLKWLREYFWIAKARLLNWREEESVGFTSKEILKELAKEYEAQQEEQRREEGSSPPSSGQSSFFGTYEEEMQEFLKEGDK